MKKTIILLIALLTCALALAQAQSHEFIVPGNNFADKMAWLKSFIINGTRYVIEINADENIVPQTFSISGGRVTIVLRGLGEKRTLSIASDGAMFTIGSGVMLILDNITIQGLNNSDLKDDFLLKVNANAALNMSRGSSITGNKNGGIYVEGSFFMDGGTISDNGGSGVSVGKNGSFFMADGTISNNKGGGVDGHGTFSMNGGNISANKINGVSINDGTFNMSSGRITNNEGSGVFVGENASFTMSGGAITLNSANQGGGVHVSGGGSFIMRGGNITANTAREAGGGVYVGGNFNKTGGTITGFLSDQRGGNIIKNNLGAIKNKKGHAVYADVSNEIKIKDGSSAHRDNMSYNDNTDPPTAAGAWDE